MGIYKLADLRSSTRMAMIGAGMMIVLCCYVMFLAMNEKDQFDYGYLNQDYTGNTYLSSPASPTPHAQTTFYLSIFGIILFSAVLVSTWTEYAKNEYPETLEVDGQEITITYTNGRMDSYTFEEIEYVRLGYGRFPNGYHLKIKPNSGREILLCTQYIIRREADELYAEFSSHPSYKPQKYL